MPRDLPQSYKFKYFFSNRNPVVGGPLLIYDPNVTSSARGLQRSSLLLFSPCNFDPSNVDHDDDVMSLDEFDPIPKIDLFTVPFKSTIQKKNYDASKKFQYSWATKLPWAKFNLSSNGNLHTIKCKIYSVVEGKEILATKWDSFCKHAS
jgi:hypothetical protein